MQHSELTLRAVAALVAAGIVRAEDAGRAGDVIGPLVPQPRAPYSFKTDAEFLIASIEHHVDSYYEQVILPLHLSHVNKATGQGRIIRDEEVSEASIGLTESVVKEIGAEYTANMERYFGKDGLVPFVFSRIYRRLLAESQKYNDEFLGVMHTRTRGRRLAGPAEKKD
jgi:hypothetical protein